MGRAAISVGRLRAAAEAAASKALAAKGKEGAEGRPAGRPDQVRLPRGGGGGRSAAVPHARELRVVCRGTRICGPDHLCGQSFAPCGLRAPMGVQAAAAHRLSAVGHRDGPSVARDVQARGGRVSGPGDPAGVRGRVGDDRRGPRWPAAGTPEVCARVGQQGGRQKRAPPPGLRTGQADGAGRTGPRCILIAIPEARPGCAIQEGR